jgi:fatty acid desaturase
MRSSAVSRSAARPRPAISRAANSALVAGSLGVTGLQVGLAPVLLHRAGAWGGVLVVLTVLVTPLQWAVIHESLHGLLWPRAHTNDRVGRVLCVVFGVPFHGLRFGHLAHHRFNRCPVDRPEIYDPARESWQHAALRHYVHILGGMYVGSVAAGLAILLPRPFVKGLIRAKLPAGDPDLTQMGRVADEQLAGRFLGSIRLDALCVLAVFGGTLLLYASEWPWALAAWAGRAGLVSLTDNAYHYGTPLAGRTYALNFGLPRWASGALLHINLHRVHHAHPQLPWRQIRATSEEEAHIDAGYVRGVLRQLCGPVPLAGVSE